MNQINWIFRSAPRLRSGQKVILPGFFRALCEIFKCSWNFKQLCTSRNHWGLFFPSPPHWYTLQPQLIYFYMSIWLVTPYLHQKCDAREATKVLVTVHFHAPGQRKSVVRLIKISQIVWHHARVLLEWLVDDQFVRKRCDSSTEFPRESTI